jgi:hypothetical protein
VRVGDLLRILSESLDRPAIRQTSFALRVGPLSSGSQGMKEVVNYLRERGASKVQGIIKPLKEITMSVWHTGLASLNESALFDGVVIDTSNLLSEEVEKVVTEARTFFPVTLLVPLGRLVAMTRFLESGIEIWYMATEFECPTIQTYSESYNNPFIIHSGDGDRLAAFLKTPCGEDGSPIPSDDLLILEQYPTLVTIVWSLNSGNGQNCLLADHEYRCSGKEGTSEFGSLESWGVFCRFLNSFSGSKRVVIDSLEKIPKNWL